MSDILDMLMDHRRESKSASLCLRALREANENPGIRVGIHCHGETTARSYLLMIDTFMQVTRIAGNIVDHEVKLNNGAIIECSVALKECSVRFNLGDGPLAQ